MFIRPIESRNTPVNRHLGREEIVAKTRGKAIVYYFPKNNQYEVHLITIRPITAIMGPKPLGNYTHFETIASAAQFGTKAWSYNNKKGAFDKYNEIVLDKSSKRC